MSKVYVKCQYTPGPWTVGSSFLHDIAWVDAPGMPSGVCDLYHHVDANAVLECTTFVPKPNAEANARLISAAPDLLEALEKLLPWHDANPVEPTTSPLIQQCREAIAKARGNDRT